MNYHSTTPRTTLSSPLLRVTAVLLLLAIVSALVLGCATPQVRTETAMASLAAGDGEGFIPALFGSPFDATPTPEPTATPTITPTPDATPGATPLPPPLPAPTTIVSIPPIDFDAARAEAQSKGLNLTFVKIGFHVAVGGNANGLGDWERKLNDAGVPIFLKSVDAGGPLYEVQQIMKANEAAGRFVDHTLVFRLTDPKFEAPFYNYNVSPELAASVSWPLNRDNFPKELEKEYIWYETLNEPGRIGGNGELQIERLARFSLATAKQAVAEGYRYAALSWSTGVPEREDWENPDMLEFLRYAGEHPDQVAVALHEYSLTNDFISAGYPSLVGRFQDLFDVCDQYGIPRPTVLITEWGWEYNSVPEPPQAMEDIAWAAWLYAAYPEVKGAAIWYLGPGFGTIDNQAQRLIAPLADYSISHYYFYTPGRGQIDAEIFRPNVPTLLQESAAYSPTPFPRPRDGMPAP
jgi:hypothetical protein